MVTFLWFCRITQQIFLAILVQDLSKIRNILKRSVTCKAYGVKAHLFCGNSSAHPNVKRSSEVIQIGLNETEVFQAKLGAATLGSDQGLFFVLYEDDLEYRH